MRWGETVDDMERQPLEKLFIGEDPSSGSNSILPAGAFKLALAVEQVTGTVAREARGYKAVITFLESVITRSMANQSSKRRACDWWVFPTRTGAHQQIHSQRQPQDFCFSVFVLK